MMIVCLIGVGYYAQWLTNRTREFITMERQVLNLTRPGEPVMDYKGETIYRRRPYYFILEFITRNAILHGLVPDTVAEDLVRAGCHVAQADGSQWPDRARAFMDANFLNLGRLRASGQWTAAGRIVHHRHPRRYVIIGEERPRPRLARRHAVSRRAPAGRGCAQVQCAGARTNGWPASGLRRSRAASRRSTCAISTSDGPQPHARHRAASG